MEKTTNFLSNLFLKSKNFFYKFNSIQFNSISGILIFITLIANISLSSAQSQCQVGHIVQVKGFNCTDRTGEICFISKADFISPANPCLDHIFSIEIEYPTGNFNYTDLMDFSLKSQTSQITILESEIFIVSDGYARNCLKGIVVVPNTDFTIRIVDKTNNEIVSSSTLTLPGLNRQIGSPNGFTLLSDAIFAGTVLPPSQSANTAQVLTINGTLLVDVDYVFGANYASGMPRGNAISMGPNAKIIVNNGITLGFDLAVISGCDNTWQDITVSENAALNFHRVDIYDAENAINMLDGSNATIARSRFINNNTGIGCYGATTKNVNLTFYSGPNGESIIFTSNSQDHFGLNTGCNFENVNSNLILGGYVSYQHIHTGISLWNTNLDLPDSRFLDNYYGIISDNQSQTLIIGNDSEGPYFSENYYAIFSSGSSNFKVQKSVITESEYGIVKIGNNQNELTSIKQNEIETNFENIFALPFPTVFYCNVIQNLLLSNTGHNLWAYGLGAGNHFLDVQYNDLIKSNTNRNISYNFITKSGVFKNEGIQSVSAGGNVVISGGSKNWVGYNLLDATSTFPNTYISGCPNSQIYCNTMYHNNQANMTVVEDCDGTDIRGNFFTSSSYNLMYGSPSSSYVLTGDQDHRGNIFDPSSTANRKARDFAPNGISDRNKYLVEGIQGDVFFPFFTSSNSNWFKEESGTNYSCPPGFTGGGGGATSGNPIPYTDIEHRVQLFNDGYYNGSNTNERFDAMLKTYRSIDQYLTDGNSLSTTANNWYLLYQNSEANQLYQHEKNIGLAFALSETDKNQVKLLVDSMNNLADQIGSLNHYTMSMDGSLQYIEPAHSQYVNLMSQKLSIQNQLQALENDINQSNDTKLINLMQQNQAITTTIVQATDLKKAWYLTLKSMLSNFQAFDSLELAQINQLAFTCPYQGGEGVYIARSLKALVEKNGIVYTEDCVSTAQTNSRKPSKDDSLVIEINPNPATDKLWLHIDQIGAAQTIYLYDLNGKEIGKYPIVKGAMNISIAEFENGLYILTSDDKSWSKKVVIQH